MLIKSKSKSFDLINEEKATKPQQPERLYQPRRMSWLKYIVIPTGIAFILLLILCNVDFSDNQQGADSEDNTTNCTVMAVDSNILNVRTIDLTDFYFETQCLEPDEVTLYIESYKFSNATISNNFLAGEFRIEHLIIENCQVDYIEDGAFENLYNLKSLSLRDFPVRKLTAETFSGLLSLQNFTLISSGKKLKAQQFLKPFAATISTVTIRLSNIRNMVYNLEDIFGVTLAYTQLKVLNLRGTPLGDYLPENSFNNMPNLEDLNLGDCGLKSIELTALGAIVFSSLKYLDLSDNDITSMSDEFMQAIWENNIELKTLTTTATTQGVVVFTVAVRTTSTTTTTTTTTTTKTSAESTESTESTTSEPSTSTPLSSPQTSTIESTTNAAPICPEDSTYCAEIVCSQQDYAIPYQVVIQFEDTEANNAVRVTLLPFNSHLSYHLIYFNKATQSSAKAIKTQSSQVDSLDCATSYTFCVLLFENATDTSPYNCRSHRTGDCHEGNQDLSWFQVYFILIISLGVVGILLSVSFGIFMIYIILRLKPNWLKGSKRLIRPLRDSQTMFLLPRLTELGIPNLITKDYDYIDYYRRQKRAKQCQPDSITDNMPPKERAPSIPPSVNSSCNTATTATAASYLYETFELYEELP